METPVGGDGDSRMPSRALDNEGRPFTGFSMGMSQTAGARPVTSWTEITTMSSVKKATPASRLGRSQTPFSPMASPNVKDTTPVKHHSHGLRGKCSSKRCASKKGLYGPPTRMLPVPKAKILSTKDGAVSGQKDQVLPPQPTFVTKKGILGKTMHHLYQHIGLDSKCDSPRTSPRSDFKSNLDYFENRLVSFSPMFDGADSDEEEAGGPDLPPRAATSMF